MPWAWRDKETGVQYQDEHTERVLGQMGALLREAVEQRSEGHVREAHALAERVVELALDADAQFVLSMAPQTLRAYLELENLDDRVLMLVAQAFEAEAMALEDRGEIVPAGVRREQAAEVRHLVGLEHAN